MVYSDKAVFKQDFVLCTVSYLLYAFVQTSKSSESMSANEILCKELDMFSDTAGTLGHLNEVQITFVAFQKIDIGIPTNARQEARAEAVKAQAPVIRHSNNVFPAHKIGRTFIEF